MKSEYIFLNKVFYIELISMFRFNYLKIRNWEGYNKGHFYFLIFLIFFSFTDVRGQIVRIEKYTPNRSQWFGGSYDVDVNVNGKKLFLWIIAPKTVKVFSNKESREKHNFSDYAPGIECNFDGKFLSIGFLRESCIIEDCGCIWDKKDTRSNSSCIEKLTKIFYDKSKEYGDPLGLFNK